MESQQRLWKAYSETGCQDKISLVITLFAHLDSFPDSKITFKINMVFYCTQYT